MPTENRNNYSQNNNPNSSQDSSQNRHREIKSYVLRQGRLTAAQQNALQNHWLEYGIDYSEQLLSYETVFNNNSEIIIEIGFGNGESLLQQAMNQPQYNFIGIEVHGPGVGHLIHNAVIQKLDNLKVVRHDAVDVLNNQIADNSIHRLQLFFPDPWHKKRHQKRRILNPAFIQLAQLKLKTGGFFHMATDWQHYAEQMLKQMDAAEGFENTAGCANYSETRGDRCETKFERRGIKLGHGVWDLIYKKL